MVDLERNYGGTGRNWGGWDLVWVGLGVFYASWAFGGIESGADLAGTVRRRAPASRHQLLLQRKPNPHEASHPAATAESRPSPEMLKPNLVSIVEIVSPANWGGRGDLHNVS